MIGARQVEWFNRDSTSSVSQTLIGGKGKDNCC